MKGLLAVVVLISMVTLFKSCDKSTNSSNSANSNANSASNDLVLAKKFGELAEIKTKVKDYKDLLKDKYKSNDQDPEFVATRKLYNDAHGAYDNYIKTLETAIRQGKAKKLNDDPEFKAAGQKVSDLATKFIQKADKLTSNNLGLVPGLGDVVDIGIKIWKAIADRQKADRDAWGDRVKNDLQWEPWGSMPAASPSPAH